MTDQNTPQVYIEKVAEMRANKSTRQLSPNTTKDYISAYKKLKSILGDDLISVCADEEGNRAKIIAFGEKQKNPWKISRVRNLYNAYINLMYAYNIDSEITDKYKAFLKSHQVAYQESQKSNQLTSPSQIENMITYAELLDYINQLNKIVLMDQGYIGDIKQVLLILEISKWRPYRVNEFAKMWVVDSKDFEKYTDNHKNNYNYLVKSGWDYFFHFKQYDTTKQRPQKIQHIPKPLAKIIRKYLKNAPTPSITCDNSYPLLTSACGSPEYLSQIMLKVSEDVIGKRVGSAILRKVVVSHKYQSTKNQTQEQEAFAKSIGHSLQVENLIYNKDIGE
tara:strand:- start:488 stop:1492 length:1005 start_codon:yes stop_codon:yes gene_type:complete